MTLYDIPVKTLSGEDSSLGALAGKTLLVVNVASKCGLTPQYAALEALHARLADRGFSVVGFPCNQFMGQEPGTAEEIEEFCSTTYGVTFPMFEKIEVNGEERHPIYDQLTAVPDADGRGGRRAVELREVPARPGRGGAGAVPAAHGAGRPRGAGRDREAPAGLSSAVMAELASQAENEWQRELVY